MQPLDLLASPFGILLLLVTFGYALACWAAPFRRCRRCDGLGRRRGPLGGARHCRPCRGTGRRLRAGRWVFNQFANLAPNRKASR